MSRTNQILQDALTLIERGWTQDVFARDSAGNSVSFASPNACAWCALGAISRVAEVLNVTDVEYEDLDQALCTQMRGSIAPFNDSHTKAEVITKFQAAIEAAK